MKQDSLQQVLNISLQFGVKIVAGRSTAAYLSFLAGPRPARATGCCTVEYCACAISRTCAVLPITTCQPCCPGRASDYFITEIFYQPLAHRLASTATDLSRTFHFFVSSWCVMSIFTCFSTLFVNNYMDCTFITIFVKQKTTIKQLNTDRIKSN